MIISIQVIIFNAIESPKLSLLGIKFELILKPSSSFEVIQGRQKCLKLDKKLALDA
ncbi:hypothetical protein C8P64_2659 [Christiangramia gaetbulicola]|uniref:Uncharacterized protein n=1 Tax=Christiangramia gaetbulicola TaxID=703340 RepID=A0A2T6AEK1_9FLAO|nr:hypothetical protein C8P64_2659 [Christiangramia gaetbulicola]